MHVDQVLQGTGTTNNENMARACFTDPNKFAEALEIDNKVFLLWSHTAFPSKISRNL